ncbi:MAG: hypothetical protein ABXS91_07125, partial [Sulfurimonas sp.]
SETYHDDTVCFYSGGIDSTYCISKLYEENNPPSLLTVHGMDYSLENEKSFSDFMQKTTPFAEKYGDKRFFIKTDAYDVYQKYKVNKNHHHVTHIFALAGCGFLFSGYFKEIVIASDDRLDQQFMSYPYGSNSATNYLFDDGITSLKTKNDDITRSEKLPSCLNSDSILNSLTFCPNKESQPENCGVCKKCTRTKLMFLASTGTIPDIFMSKEISKNYLTSININKTAEQIFILDLYHTAKKNNRLDLIPDLEKAKKSIIKLALKNKRFNKFKKFFLR